MCLVTYSIVSSPGYLVSTTDSSGSSYGHTRPLEHPPRTTKSTGTCHLCFYHLAFMCPLDDKKFLLRSYWCKFFSQNFFSSTLKNLFRHFFDIKKMKQIRKKAKWAKKIWPSPFWNIFWADKNAKWNQSWKFILELFSSLNIFEI